MIHNDFVSRQEELNKLRALWEKTFGGYPQVALVSGETGCGKSSLVQEFTNRAQGENRSAVVAVGHCNAQTGEGQPYLPFVELVTQLTGNVENKRAHGSLSEQSAERLKETMTVSARTLIEFAPDLLGSLIPGSSLFAKGAVFAAEKAGWIKDIDDKLEDQNRDPSEIGREQILQQYTNLIQSLAGNFPLILVLEDLQWADDSSINLFFHLIFELEACEVLLIGSYRPSSIGRMRGEGHALEELLTELKSKFGDIWVDLEDLSETQHREFVHAYLDARPNRLNTQFREALFNKTGGHPLFVVELLQSLFEKGKIWQDGSGCWVIESDLDWSLVPTKIEGVITERLRQLDDMTYDLLATASVEGVTFSVPVIAGVHHIEEWELLKLLTRQLEKRFRLVWEGEVRKVDRSWLAKYSFCTTWFQQYVYWDLSQRERMILHGRIAQMLESLYGDSVGEIRSELARHYDLAGEEQRAAEFYLAEGKRALSISSYREAIDHLRRTLELLAELPQSDSINRRMVEAYIPYSAGIKAYNGWDSEEALDCYYEARELCRKIGGSPELSPFLFGLWAYHLVHLDLDKAAEIAIENSKLGEKLGDSEIAMQGHLALGNTRFWQGHLQDCIDHMSRARSLFAPEQRDSIIQRYGQDPRSLALMFLTFSHWITGQLDTAMRMRDEMLTLAEELDHPFTLAVTLQATAWQAFHERNIRQVGEDADRLIKVSDGYGFPFYKAIGTIFAGWAEAIGGTTDQGIDRLKEGFDLQSEQTGEANIMHPVYSILLAEAQQQTGQIEEALKAVSNGLKAIELYNCPVYVAELLRLEGELLSSGAYKDTLRAQESYEQGVKTAQRQGAVLFQLRTLVSLARLLGKEPGGKAVREELRSIKGYLEGGTATWDRARIEACLDDEVDGGRP